jgi:hypothetical protein
MQADDMLLVMDGRFGSYASGPETRCLFRSSKKDRVRPLAEGLFEARVG